MTDEAGSPATAARSDAPGVAPSESFLDREHRQPQPWARLADYLGGHGLRFEADPEPEQFAGGFGNLNYLIAVDGRPAVLRTPPAGPLPPGGNDMGREYRVLSRLWRAFPLAPRALHLCPEDGVLEHPFFIMEHRPGLVVRGDLPAALDGRGAELSRMLVDVLADFHAVDPDAVGLGDLGRPDGFLERAVAGWIRRCGVASADIHDDGKPPAAAREVAAWLRAQPVPGGEVTLLHNDFKLDNIILDPADPVRPIALLDWDMCTRGDPLFDLGTLLSYWVEEGDPPAMLEVRQMPTTGGGFLPREEIVDLYARATGRDVSGFRFHRVLTLFKLGVIFQQIYARYCRGTTNDPRVVRLGPVADGVFLFAGDVAAGRAF